MSNDESPLGFLRRKLQEACSDGAADAWTLRKRITEVLHAPQWESAALRMQAVRECQDADSPWLVCKPCEEAGRCAKETIVALKSDEQASLSPGAYEVLTSAVKKRDVVSMLRGLERHGEDNIWRVAQEAREEIEALRTSLAHWKVFAKHAEGERSTLSADAARLDRFEEWLADRAGPLLHIDQIRKALK